MILFFKKKFKNKAQDVFICEHYENNSGWETRSWDEIFKGVMDLTDTIRQGKNEVIN